MSIQDSFELLEIKLRLAIENLRVDEQGRIVEERYRIQSIGSIKIEIYPNEHPPPHFHIKSSEFNATFGIENGELLTGHVDAQTRKKIAHFHSKNKMQLIEVWNKLRPDNCQVGRIPI